MSRSIRLSIFNLLNPVILCGLLLVLGIFNIHQQRNHNRQRAEAFAQEYELLAEAASLLRGEHGR